MRLFNVDALIHGLIRVPVRFEDAGSVQISLPKIGEGSGGVDIEEQRFVGASILGIHAGVEPAQHAMEGRPSDPSPKSVTRENDRNC